ncbi:MAG: preprotein translocase subunit SecG [Spirochaetes bacterium GWD1_27_9]|nr:MAG: preprotein translocase subunit SecG [Spirochaetes bacterium GWB1_27_13]OHD21760.1 MAG: preprotein translocase subunit SecG [Spirochaetes bacterium GWC1_27_15]OHD38077.1 MAG: preprotein translocase subunit SecG [Spirochaetes bacterium GWD1_27_9]
MEVLLIVLVSVVFIICILMIAVILLQEDKSGGGIGMIGGSSQSFFGASSGSMLTRITTILFTLFLVIIIVIGLISSSFSRDTVISEIDIAQTESEEYQSTTKKVSFSAPQKLTVEDFETKLMNKIKEEKDKTVINSFYKKDATNKYYELKDGLKKKDLKKVTDILKSINFSLEAEKTVLNPTTKDVTNDKK